MSSPPRTSFRVVTRLRGGYEDGLLFDVQLQSLDTGALLWAQTFSSGEEAQRFEATVAADLAELDDEAFRRKHGVPAGA